MIKRIDVISKKRKWTITTDFYGQIDNHENWHDSCNRYKYKDACKVF